LEQVAETTPLVFPVHPRTRSNLSKFHVAISERITLCDPLPYMEFLNLWKDATLVLTDSGGLQEETTALRVPCITLRENTERPVTVTEGTNTLVGCESDAILAAAAKATEAGSGMAKSAPRFWDGRAAERVVAILAAHYTQA